MEDAIKVINGFPAIWGEKNVWRKTRYFPKPVGVELLIKRNGVELRETCPGSPYFLHHGLVQVNTVYSYDNTEEWFDDGTIEPFKFTEEQELYLLKKLKDKYETIKVKI